MDPKRIERIDMMAKKDFERLQEAIDDLKIPDKETPDSIKLQSETLAINKLSEAFQKVAECYFTRAKTFIQDTTYFTFDAKHTAEIVQTVQSLQNRNFASKDDILIPLEKAIQQLTYNEIGTRNRAYFRVLDKLVQHADLLADTVRAYRNFLRFHSGNFDAREAVKYIIDGIATRFPENLVFIPLIDNDFKAIRFTYCHPVVVIAMPPSVLSLSPWHLGVIWHEMGGYGVTELKEQHELQKWVLELPTEVNAYFQRAYQHSNGTDDSEPSHWHEDWLGECCEDLFGVRALQETTIEALLNALTQHYSDLTKSDREHPPADLRLQVVLEYLKIVKPDYDRQFLSIIYIENDLNKKKPELRQAAKEIARFYHKKVQQATYSMYLGKRTLRKWEKNVAAIVRRESDDLKAQNKTKELRECYQEFSNSKKIKQVDGVENETKEFKDFKELITEAWNIEESLLNISFTKITRATVGFYSGESHNYEATSSPGRSEFYPPRPGGTQNPWP
jgi:hypothetical protein